MMQHPVFQQMATHRVIPILAGSGDLSKVLPICDSLIQAGLPLIEITLRTGPSLEAIRLVAAERPGMLLGAGTVITPDQADRAVKAGAHFLVSPGLDPALVQLSRDIHIPLLPGVCTPTEVQTALGLGLDLLKFFPASSMGGPETLRLMAGPFPSIRFVPTGGIKSETLSLYLSLPNVLACGGTWMFGKKFDCGEIKQRAAETVAIVARLRDQKGPSS